MLAPPRDTLTRRRDTLEKGSSSGTCGRHGGRKIKRRASPPHSPSRNARNLFPAARGDAHHSGEVPNGKRASGPRPSPWATQAGAHLSGFAEERSTGWDSEAGYRILRRRKPRMVTRLAEQVLAGKVGVVFGGANKRSIAWAIAKSGVGGARLISITVSRVKETWGISGEFGRGRRHPAMFERCGLSWNFREGPGETEGSI